MIYNFKEFTNNIISEKPKESIKKIIELSQDLPLIKKSSQGIYEEISWDDFFILHSKDGTKGICKEYISKIEKILEMFDFWCDKESKQAYQINKILYEIRNEYNIILPELKKMLKYKEINESRGVNNHTKKYVEEITKRFIKGNNFIVIDFDYEGLSLINMCVQFEISKEYHGEFNPEFVEMSAGKMCNCLIKIKHPKNYDIIKIKEAIIHELNHANEYFNYLKKIEELDIDVSKGLGVYLKIRPSWIDINIIKKELSHININSHKNETFEYFLYYVYLSLDNEMNARVAQVYPYLKTYNSKYKNVLLEILHKHDVWKYSDLLSMWNHKIFINNILTTLKVEDIISLTNIMSCRLIEKGVCNRVKLLENIGEIKNKEDVYKFYSIWENLFYIKAKTNKEKLVKMIDEVIKDNFKLDEEYYINYESLKLYVSEYDEKIGYKYLKDAIKEDYHYTIKRISINENDTIKVDGYYKIIGNYTTFSKYCEY